MGFEFIAFGAATVPLSKVVIDKELDMGTYPIRAQYRPEEWATEELDWGDEAPHEEALPSGGNRRHDSPPFTVLTAARSEYVTIRVTVTGTDPLNVCNVLINDETVYEHGYLSKGRSAEFTGFINTGDVVSVDARTQTTQLITVLSVVGIFSGLLGGSKTFDLTGKWLAVGLDMKGLAATVKVQGVEMPYSEYVKAFPLVPSELSFPGGWGPTQERPVIKRYV